MSRNELYRASGAIIILVTGLIHLYDAPGEYQEALYMGILFIVFTLLSIVAAIGILRDQLIWGWLLGALLSLGAIVGYLLSRTIGLPLMEVEDWGPPLAYFSFFFEIVYFIPLVGFFSPRLREASC